MDARAMNRKYQTIKITPRRLSNFQPFKWTDIKRNTTVDSNDIVEYVKPVGIIQTKYHLKIDAVPVKRQLALFFVCIKTNQQTFRNDIDVSTSIDNCRLYEPW